MYLSSLIRNAPAADPTAWSAEHHVTVRSYLDLTSRLTFDNSFYYASRMEVPGIPALKRFDTHLGWKLSRHLTASVTGQNLLSPRHFESNAVNLVSSTQVPRAFLGRLEWTF